MADKLIIDCYTGQIRKENYTQEELEEVKKRQEEEKNKTKPQPTKEEEIEDLKRQLEDTQKSMAEMMNLIAIQGLTPTQ